MNKFPYVYGGSNGDTMFTAMDVEFVQGNLAAGGQSSDSGIVTSGTKPIMVLFDKNGAITWAQTFTPISVSGASSNTLNIASVYFKSSTQVGFAATNGNLYLILLNVVGGTISKVHADISTTTYSLTPNGMVIDTSPNFFITGQVHSAWFILGTKLGNGAEFYGYTTTGTAFGYGRAITFGETQSALFVAGLMQTTSGAAQSDSIARFTILNNAFTLQWNYVNNQGTIANPFYTKVLEFNPGALQLSACSDSGVTGQVQFTRILMTAAYVVTSATTLSTSATAGVSYSCYGLHSSGSDLYTFIYDSTSQNYYYTYVWTAGAKIQYAIMDTYSGNVNSVLNSATFYHRDMAYYAGYSTIVKNVSPTITYTYKVAHVMASNTDFTCFPVTSTLGAKITLNPYNLFAPDTTILTSISPLDQSTAPTLSSLSTATPSSVISCIPNYSIYTSPPAAPFVNQNYIVKSVARTVSFTAFTADCFCTTSAMTYTMLLSTGAAVPSFITLDTTLLQINTYTALNSNVGVYTINLSGCATLYPTQCSSAQIKITVTSSCQYATISAPSPTAQFYLLSQTAALYSIPSFTTNDTDCTIDYSLTMGDGTAIDSTLITYSASSNQMSTYTTNSGKFGTYPLKTTGAITGFATTTASATFSLKVEACLPIISTSIPNIPYVISSGTKSMTALGWTTTQPCTQTFTYAVQSAGGTSAPSFVSMSGSTVQITSVDHTIVGTYSLQVVGSVNSIVSATKTFTLTVSNDCSTTTLTPDTISSKSYTLGETANIFTFNAWTSSYSDCQSLVYAASETSPTVQSLPSFISFFSNSKQFSISSTDLTIVGTYTIQVSCIANNLPANQQLTTFQLVVNNPCTSIVLTTTAVTDQTYNTYDSALTITIPNFTSSAATNVCSTISYAMVSSTDSGTTYIPPDNNVFTFSPGNPSSLSVSTSDATKANTYYIKITGTQGTYTSSSASIVFKVNIIDSCYNTIITTSSITSQSYTIGDSIIYIPITSFTESKGGCGSFTYTATLLNGDNLPSFITYDSTLQQISVVTNDPSFTTIASKVFTIKIVGTLGVYKSSQIQFDLTVTNPCYSLVITIASITSPQTYTVSNSALTNNIVVTTSSSICGALSYTAYQSTVSQSSGQTALDSGLFSIISGSPYSFQVYATLVSYVGYYYIQVIVSNSYGSQQVLFEINVVNICSSTVITPAVVSPSSYTYFIGDGALEIDIGAFSESVGTCGTFTYVAQLSSGSLPTFISFDDSTRIFQIASSDATKVSTYTIDVVGTLGAFGSQTSSFTLIVSLPCSNTAIVTTALAAQSYTIGSSDKYITFTAFTATDSTCTASFVYTASITSPLVSSLPSFITFDPNSRQFTISSADTNDAGSYTIEVLGVLTSTLQATISFDLTVVNPCLTLTVTSSSSISPVSYNVDDTVYSITIPDFVSSIPTSICGLFSYTETQSTGGSGYVALDTAVFTFVQATPNLLNVLTTDVLKATTYNIKIVAQVGTYNTGEIDFIVDIIDGCINTIISDTAVVDKVYVISQVALIISFPSFSDSVGHCGVFTYQSTLYQPYTGALPSFIAFDDIVQEYSVYSTSLTNVGSYTILLTGTLGTYGSKSMYITLTVQEAQSSCISSTISPSAEIDTQFYTVGDAQLSILIKSFNESVATCGSIVYNATYDNGTSMNSSIFTLVSNPVALNVYSNNALTYNYTIKISGKYETYPAISNYQEFMVCITQPTSTYSVPTSTSSSSSPTTSSSSSKSQSTNTTNTTNSTSNTSTSISGSSSNSQDTTSSSSSATASVSDSSDYSSSSSYSGKWSPTSNLNIDSLISMPNIVSNPENIYAYFQKVTVSATAIVKFSQSIHVPSNFKQFDNSILQIQYIPSTQQSNATLQSWKITTFTATQMEIALNFSDPLLVSTTDEDIKDQLSLIFIDQSQFKAESTNQTVQRLQQISSQIPTQLSANDVKVLKTLQSSVSSSVTVIQSTILPLQQAGLSQLWGLINSLQLLMALPTLNIEFPANAEMFFGFFVQITTFQFYDPTPIIAKVMNVSAIELNNAPTTIEQMGLNSTNIFINMATYFIVLALLGIVTIFVKKLSKLQFKRPILSKVMSYLEDTFVYGSILRSIVEGYFIFAVSTLLGVQTNTDSPSEIAATVFSWMCLAFLLVIPIYVLSFLMANQSKLNDQSFQGQFISLYQDIDVSGKGILFTSVFLVRRLLLAATIVFAQDYGGVQLLLFITSSILYLIFTMFFNVFTEPFLLYMDFFNEYIFTLSMYVSICFCGFDADDDFKKAAGWLIVGLLMFSIIVNFMVIINSIIREVKFKIKQFRYKRKILVEGRLRQAIMLRFTQQKIEKSNGRTAKIIRQQRFARMVMLGTRDMSFNSPQTQEQALGQTEYEEMKIQDLCFGVRQQKIAS